MPSLSFVRFLYSPKGIDMSELFTLFYWSTVCLFKLQDHTVFITKALYLSQKVSTTLFLKTVLAFF